MEKNIASCDAYVIETSMILPFGLNNEICEAQENVTNTHDGALVEHFNAIDRVWRYDSWIEQERGVAEGQEQLDKDLDIKPVCNEEDAGH